MSNKQFFASTGLTHAVAVDHHQFIGCLRSLKYRELIDVTWEVSPTIVMQATSGCQDLCQGENPCGEGRCVNLYTSVHCDCSLLDREGDKCQYSSKLINRYQLCYLYPKSTISAIFLDFFGDFDLSDLVDHIYKNCFKKLGKCRSIFGTYEFPPSFIRWRDTCATIWYQYYYSVSSLHCLKLREPIPFYLC